MNNPTVSEPNPEGVVVVEFTIGVVGDGRSANPIVFEVDEETGESVRKDPPRSSPVTPP